MNSSIRTWLYRFLDSRGLAHATGKPLYTYRITLAEYDELRSLLKHAFKLPDPFGETPTLEAACLLFSAARLSLAYAEGAWQWKTVDEELPRELTFDEHKRIVKTGAVWWRLHHSIQDDGKRFIGFVMIQAGISLNALENDAGLIAKGIQETLRLIRKYPELSEATLREYVRSQVPRPDSFAEHLFVDLLCTASRALYRAFKSLPERPTEADFVKAYGTVKDDFPACFFEVKHLERLYQARLRVKQSSSPLFNIRRFVRWNPDDPSIPRLVATARLPKTVSHVSAEELAFYFHNFSGPKPNQLASILVNGRLMARLRRTNAEPIGFSVRTNERIRIEGNEAAKGLFSLMRWMDGHTDEIVLGNLGPLDPDEPVAFARTTVEDEWVSVGSGSVKTVADRVLLACRADALLTATKMPANMLDTQDKDVSPSTQLRLLAFDWLEVGGKKLAIYEVRTNCRVKIDGDEYNIVLRAACGIEQSYWLQGQFFESPVLSVEYTDNYLERAGDAALVLSIFNAVAHSAEAEKAQFVVRTGVPTNRRPFGYGLPANLYRTWNDEEQRRSVFSRLEALAQSSADADARFRPMNLNFEVADRPFAVHHRQLLIRFRNGESLEIFADHGVGCVEFVSRARDFVSVSALANHLFTLVFADNGGSVTLRDAKSHTTHLSVSRLKPESFEETPS